LLDCLIQGVVIANDCRGDTGELFVQHRADIEGFDVKAPPTKESCNTGKNTEFIFDEYGDGMAHEELIKISAPPVAACAAP
jgi:hypothetical protein